MSIDRTQGTWEVRRAHGGGQYHHVASAASDNIAVFTRLEDAEYVASLVNAAPAMLKALESSSHLLMAVALIIPHAESRHHAISVSKDAKAAAALAPQETPK